MVNVATSFPNTLILKPLTTFKALVSIIQSQLLNYYLKKKVATCEFYFNGTFLNIPSLIPNSFIFAINVISLETLLLLIIKIKHLKSEDHARTTVSYRIVYKFSSFLSYSRNWYCSHNQSRVNKPKNILYSQSISYMMIRVEFSDSNI